MSSSGGEECTSTQQRVKLRFRSQEVLIPQQLAQAGLSLLFSPENASRILAAVADSKAVANTLPVGYSLADTLNAVCAIENLDAMLEHSELLVPRHPAPPRKYLECKAKLSLLKRKQHVEALLAQITEACRDQPVQETEHYEHLRAIESLALSRVRDCRSEEKVVDDLLLGNFSSSAEEDE